MTDIFISYKQEDRQHAHAIAEMFAIHGYDVWWDIELLPGQKFADEINSVIKKAKAAIVLWTPSSVSSDWVKAETTIAMDRGILIPAWLEKVDLPAPYNTLHTIDLTSWDGSPHDPILEGLLAGVNNLIGKPAKYREDLSKEEIEVVLEKPAHETEFWSTVAKRRPQSVDEYRAYLKKYGNDGSFAKLADIRIKELLELPPDKKHVGFKVALTLSGVAVGIIVGLFQIAVTLGWLPVGNGLQNGTGTDTDKPMADTSLSTINDFNGFWKASYQGVKTNGYTMIMADGADKAHICKVDDQFERVEKKYVFKSFDREQKQLSYEFVRSDNTVVPYSVSSEKKRLVGTAEKEGGGVSS